MSLIGVMLLDSIGLNFKWYHDRMNAHGTNEKGGGRHRKEDSP